MDKKDNENNNKETRQQDEKNWLEWLVFAVALLLLLSILSYLGYKAYTHQPTPPDLVIDGYFEPGPNEPNRYHIKLENRGGATAEEVILEVALMKGEEELEIAQLNIPLAPQASKREGWVGFRNSPANADTVIARVVSYKKP